MQTKLPLIVMFVWLVYAAPAAARDLMATPANLRQQVAALRPGDNLVQLLHRFKEYHTS